MEPKDQENNKNKETKSKLIEEAAERLAQILIMQIELKKSDAQDITIASQKNCNNKN